MMKKLSTLKCKSTFCLFTLCLLIALISCQTEKEDLEKYSVNGETEKIFQFIKDTNSNLRDGEYNANQRIERLETVEYAIGKIVKNNKAGNDKLMRLEDLFSYQSTNNVVRRKIIHAFNENDLVFRNRSLICGNFYDRYSQGIITEIETMIINYTNTEAYEECFNFKEMYEYYDQKTSIYIDDSRAEQSVKNLLDSISKKTEGDEILDWVSKKRNWLNVKVIETKISELREELRGQRYQLERKQTERNNIEGQIEKSNHFQLSGAIISQVASGYQGDVYEIATIRSQNHSLLYTTESKYTSSGYFRLLVKKAGKIPVKTKGGFNPDWEVYQEVTSEDVDALDEKKNRLDKLDSEISEIKSINSGILSTIDSLNTEKNRPATKTKVIATQKETSKKLKFNYQINNSSKLELWKIKIGTRISEAEEKFSGLKKVTGESYDLGYGGGGPVYLYYDDEDLIFGIVPRQGSETIIAIVAISPKLKTQNGLNPNSTAGEILEKFPDIKVRQGAFHGWEYISKKNEKWSFVFKTDGSKTVGEYAESMSETPTEPVNLDIKADWVTIK